MEHFNVHLQNLKCVQWYGSSAERNGMLQRSLGKPKVCASACWNELMKWKREDLSCHSTANTQFIFFVGWQASLPCPVVGPRRLRVMRGELERVSGLKN